MENTMTARASASELLGMPICWYSHGAAVISAPKVMPSRWKGAWPALPSSW